MRPVHDQQERCVVAFGLTKLSQRTTNTSSVPSVSALGERRSAEPLAEFPPRRGQHGCGGVVNRLPLWRRTCLKQVMFDALFPSFANPNHTEEFLPMRNRPRFLRQIVAPILVIGQRLNEENGALMPIGVALQASRFRVRETSALKVLKC